ncbi:MAG: endolytic transglycosylase MltG [Oscillospiraceae bacterium]|nr:endolytic transglycosylase MltG [Oscillospiraceae bacterium]
MSEQTPPEKKPFQLNIDLESMDLNADIPVFNETDAPKSKGEIYFANPPSALRQAAATASAPKKPKKGHAIGLLGLVLIISFAATAILSWVGIASLRDIFAMGKDEEEVSISLPADLTTNEVIDVLKSKGLISQPLVCKFYAEFTFWIKNRNADEPKQPVYVATEYVVTKDMGLEELLNTFKSQPKTSATVPVGFPEGYTAKQIMEKLSKKSVTRMDLMQKSLMSDTFDYPFIKAINAHGRYYKYEGYLFPDTYEFYVGELSNSAIRRFFDNFNAKWTEKYASRAKELNMTVDQIITLASIVQKEAANNDQMPDVSAVLHNRLSKPEAYPKLECDSTRDYVTNNIAAQMDQSTATYYYSIYNTYQCTGLPAGPICNPGIAAIEAALYPKNSDYYYFQHDKNGRMYLSKTKAEHDKVTTDLVIAGLNQ